MLLPKKKSQATIFIIVGILVLSLFFIYMGVFSKISQKKSATAQLYVSQTDISLKQFNSYLQKCLDIALDDGLFLIGRQGGFIFKEQEGSIIDFEIQKAPFKTYHGMIEKNNDIAFVNDNSIPAYVMNPPYYPCFDFTNLELDRSMITWPEVLMGKLCHQIYRHNMQHSDILFSSMAVYQKIKIKNRQTGLRMPLCSQDIVIYDNQTPITICSVSNVFPETKKKYSIQSQLENYIKYRMEQCFYDAESYITDEMQAEILQKEPINVTIIFGDDYTGAKLLFPIKLSYKKSQAVTKSFEFFSKSKVRFKAIYSLLYGDNILVKNRMGSNLTAYTSIKKGIIDMDLENISFDVVLDSPKIMNEMNLHNITVSKVYDSYGSIIKVTDYLSSIDNNPYSYYVRLRNRIPALDSVSINPISGYDIFAYENSSLAFVLAPEAFDFDDEYAPENETGSLLKFYYEPDESWKFRQNDFYNNPLYQTGRFGNVECRHSKYGITKNRCTMLFLNSSDVGSHRLTIKVEDSGNLFDYQELNVFIDKRRNITYSIENIYEDIPSYYVSGFSQPRFVVSLEDPFIINTSKSIVSIAHTTNQFKWEDLIYNASHINLTDFYDPKTNFKNNYPFYFSVYEKAIVHPNYSNFSNISFFNQFINFTNYYNQRMDYYSNEDIITILDDKFKQFTSVFDINRKSGYPFVPQIINGNLLRESAIKLSYYVQGSEVDSVVNPIYIADCMPHRSETPSYPFNLLRTLNTRRQINPYFANHTCCIGDLSVPSSWELARNGTICFSSNEIGTYYEFMQDPSKNISSDLFRKMNPNFNFNVKVLNEKTHIDRYVRTLEGRCNGERGNVCFPTKYEIQKLPYCGYRNNPFVFNPSKFGNMIMDTEIPDVAGEKELYYNNSLCLCSNLGQPIILNVSDDSPNNIFNNQIPTNQLYCCFDERNGIPAKLSSIPCHIPECAKFDSWNNSAEVINISRSVYDSRMPLCKCGLEIVNISEKGNSYCCNNFRMLYAVKDSLSECKIILPPLPEPDIFDACYKNCTGKNYIAGGCYLNSIPQPENSYINNDYSCTSGQTCYCFDDLFYYDKANFDLFVDSCIQDPDDYDIYEDYEFCINASVNKDFSICDVELNEVIEICREDNPNDRQKFIDCLFDPDSYNQEINHTAIKCRNELNLMGATVYQSKNYCDNIDSSFSRYYKQLCEEAYKQSPKLKCNNVQDYSMKQICIALNTTQQTLRLNIINQIFDNKIKELGFMLYSGRYDSACNIFSNTDFKKQYKCRAFISSNIQDCNIMKELGCKSELALAFASKYSNAQKDYFCDKIPVAYLRQQCKI